MRRRRGGCGRREGWRDGVEVVASHGYLPAQFLNPRVNLQQDSYGGDRRVVCGSCARCYRRSGQRQMRPLSSGCASARASAMTRG
ncbi:MAG: hypothetical protein R3D90_14310 [Paracoccaceae bacterium]